MDFGGDSLEESCGGHEFMEGSPFYEAMQKARGEVEKPTRKPPKKSNRTLPQIWAMGSATSFNKQRIVEDQDETIPIDNPDPEELVPDSIQALQMKKHSHRRRSNTSRSTKDAEASLAQAMQRRRGSSLIGRVSVQSGEPRSSDLQHNAPLSSSLTIPHAPPATLDAIADAPSTLTSTLQFKPRQRNSSVRGGNPPALSAPPANLPMSSSHAAATDGSSCVNGVARHEVPVRVAQSIQKPTTNTANPSASTEASSPVPLATRAPASGYDELGKPPRFAHGPTQTAAQLSVRDRVEFLNSSTASKAPEEGVQSPARQGNYTTVPQPARRPALEVRINPNPNPNPNRIATATANGMAPLSREGKCVVMPTAGKPQASSGQAGLHPTPAQNRVTPPLSSATVDTTGKATPQDTTARTAATTAPTWGQSASKPAPPTVISLGPTARINDGGSAGRTPTSDPTTSGGTTASRVSATASSPTNSSRSRKGGTVSPGDGKMLAATAKASSSGTQNFTDTDSNTSSTALSPTEGPHIPTRRSRHKRPSIHLLFPATATSPSTMPLSIPANQAIPPNEAEGVGATAPLTSPTAAAAAGKSTSSASAPTSTLERSDPAVVSGVPSPNSHLLGVQSPKASAAGASPTNGSVGGSDGGQRSKREAPLHVKDNSLASSPVVSVVNMGGNGTMTVSPIARPVNGSSADKSLPMMSSGGGSEPSLGSHYPMQTPSPSAKDCTPSPHSPTTASAQHTTSPEEQMQQQQQQLRPHVGRTSAQSGQSLSSAPPATPSQASQIKQSPGSSAGSAGVGSGPASRVTANNGISPLPPSAAKPAAGTVPVVLSLGAEHQRKPIVPSEPSRPPAAERGNPIGDTSRPSQPSQPGQALLKVPAPPPSAKKLAPFPPPNRVFPQPRREDIRLYAEKIPQQVQRSKAGKVKLRPSPTKSKGYDYPYLDSDENERILESTLDKLPIAPDARHEVSPEPPKPLGINTLRQVSTSESSFARWSLSAPGHGTKYLNGSFASTVRPGDYGDWIADPLVASRSTMPSASRARSPGPVNGGGVARSGEPASHNIDAGEDDNIDPESLRSSVFSIFDGYH